MTDVEVNFTGEFKSRTAEEVLVIDPATGREYWIPITAAKIEDDPKLNLTGAVRRVEGGGLYVKFQINPSDNWIHIGSGVEKTDRQMMGSEPCDPLHDSQEWYRTRGERHG